MKCNNRLVPWGIASICILLASCDGWDMAAKKETSKKLRTYRVKRDFSVSPEPEGKHTKPSKQSIFVIQKHDASHLHYDLRLEIDGVLVSWAVPKGPSTNPADKRLAMLTEDHPMEYANFEGVIPEGNYGAGPVMIWDRGTFENRTVHKNVEIPLHDAYHKGHIDFWLNGKKLQGGYTLVRMGKDPYDKRWLLIKQHDDYARERQDIVKRKPRSVVTDRTIAQIKKDGM